MSNYSNIDITSFRSADSILKDSGLYDEICEIANLCPIPVLKNKSNIQKKKDVVQQVMNTYFKNSFKKSKSWFHETEVSKSNEDKLRADFSKEKNGKKVQIEVEFGNSASCYRNYFKFLLAFQSGITDVGVLIVPEANLATRIDSGVSFYSKAIRELKQSKMILQVPILVIGIKNHNNEIDLSMYGFKPGHKFNKNESKIKQGNTLDKYLSFVN